MSAEGRCEETRELISEVALGIADGEERARVLEHVAGCGDCRAELERQSTVADELLSLAPGLEPPLGFELGVRRAIEPPKPSRRRFLRPLVAATAVVAAGRPGGVAFTYRGAPSWILVTVGRAFRDSVAGAELVERDGRRIPLESFELVDGAWGGSIPGDLGNLAAIDLVDRDGRTVLVARL